MKNKYENLVWIIFVVFGVVFLSVGLFINEFTSIKDIDKVETTAEITKILCNDDDCETFVRYEVNGNFYNSILNSYSSSYYEGKEIIIYYDRNDPHKIMDDSGIILSYVFSGIGILFFLISVIIIYVRKRNEKLITRLKETGYVINANYLSTVINKNYTVNNRHPYNISCEWNNSVDGKKYIFKSKNIWIDPENIIKEKNLKTFRVYYNPNNIKQYYVDIDIILDSFIDLR